MTQKTSKDSGRNLRVSVMIERKHEATRNQNKRSVLSLGTSGGIVPMIPMTDVKFLTTKFL